MIKLEGNINQSALINWKGDEKHFFFLSPEIKVKRFQYNIICDIWVFCFLDCFGRKWSLEVKGLQQGLVEEPGGSDAEMMAYVQRIGYEWEVVVLKGLFNARGHEVLEMTGTSLLFFHIETFYTIRDPRYLQWMWASTQENLNFQI